jgi:hypothetical protein
MTIKRHGVVDFAGIDPLGDALLTISDHFPWDDLKEHLLRRQEKFNTYLRFIDSGEIYPKYPRSAGREIVMDVVLKYSTLVGAR